MMPCAPAPRQSIGRACGHHAPQDTMSNAARRDLPPRVFPKGHWYYLVRADGKKRVWTKLTRIREGVPALYRKLADLAAQDVATDDMGALVATWQTEVSSTRSVKTQANDAYMCREISQALQEFRAGEVRPPDVAEFLKRFRAMPRTYNAYRSTLRELMRFAEEKGHREPGTNPVDSIRTMSVTARQRYITDSELRRIKVAAMYGEDNKRTRSGPMICALVDVAYLTGQRIGDLLTLQWGEVGRDGILFKPGKTAGSTAASVLIEWTPRLKDAIARLRDLAKAHKTNKVERLQDFKRRAREHVFTTQEGEPYTYWGASTAWRRAVKRAGIEDCHFHDLRAKAITDKESREGMQAARRMGAHSTESQTADYVRHKKAQSTGATR